MALICRSFNNLFVVKFQTNWSKNELAMATYGQFHVTWMTESKRIKHVRLLVKHIHCTDLKHP